MPEVSRFYGIVIRIYFKVGIDLIGWELETRPLSP